MKGKFRYMKKIELDFGVIKKLKKYINLLDELEKLENFKDKKLEDKLKNSEEKNQILSSKNIDLQDKIYQIKQILDLI